MNPQAKSMETVNGVNVTELLNNINAAKTTPGVARFKFRIDNEWLNCGHNRSTVESFYGAERDHAHPQPFVLEADEPPLLLGRDQGANPVEYLLHALAACVTTSMVYHAAAKGIAIEEVESTVEGSLDLRGFLGVDPKVRKGYENIRMNFRIKADVSPDQLEALCKLGPAFSPVFDCVTRGVPVTVNCERLE